MFDIIWLAQIQGRWGRACLWVGVICIVIVDYLFLFRVCFVLFVGLSFYFFTPMELVYCQIDNLLLFFGPLRCILVSTWLPIVRGVYLQPHTTFVGGCTKKKINKKIWVIGASLTPDFSARTILRSSWCSKSSSSGLNNASFPASNMHPDETISKQVSQQ